MVIEGGIIAYDSNIRTGGLGAKYLGIGASGQYRTDQVTVNLRAVMSAIDAAVIHLIVKGIKRGMWSARDPKAMLTPSSQGTLKQKQKYFRHQASSMQGFVGNGPYP